MARYLRDLEMRDPTPEELEQKRVERQRAHEEELEFSNGIEAHPPGRRGGPCPLCAQKDKEIAKLQAEISAGFDAIFHRVPEFRDARGVELSLADKIRILCPQSRKGGS